MRDLVNLAQHLADLSGSRDNALHLAVAISKYGVRAFESVGGDRRRFLEGRAVDYGIIDQDGRPLDVRTAELIVICSILADAGGVVSTKETEDTLLFTVPNEALGLIEPRQRIVLAVEDVIRMSRQTVQIGAPFWDDPGFDRLLDVLEPAVKDRGVKCTFYLHAWPKLTQRKRIQDRISALQPQSTVSVHWYQGPASSLMHAKFVIADSSKGILSTANHTSYGLEHHIEVGVPLGSEQCGQLEQLLAELVANGFFTTTTQVD